MSGSTRRSRLRPCRNINNQPLLAPPTSLTLYCDRVFFFFLQAEDGIRDHCVTGVQTCALPICDITLRALATIAAADLVLCEDTRVTRKLLDRYGLAPPLLAYHDHNAAEVRPRILQRLAQGGAVALVSDAGTPLISDPGYKLVAAAIEAGHRVYPIPGASALLAALVAAGLPTDRFYF